MVGNLNCFWICCGVQWTDVCNYVTLPPTVYVRFSLPNMCWLIYEVTEKKEERLQGHAQGENSRANRLREKSRCSRAQKEGQVAFTH